MRCKTRRIDDPVSEAHPYVVILSLAKQSRRISRRLSARKSREMFDSDQNDNREANVPTAIF